MRIEAVEVRNTVVSTVAVGTGGVSPDFVLFHANKLYPAHTPCRGLPLVFEM